MLNASLPHLNTPYQDGFVTVAPGVSLAYTDVGAGQTILLLTGWTFTKEVFEKQIPALSRSFRVVAYDPRSQGASSFTVEGNDYLTHAEDLAALIKALKIETPILCGWATGALTAWAYIRAYGVASVAANIAIDVMPKCLSTDPDAWVEGSFEQIAGIHTLYLRDAAGHASFVRRYTETFMIERELNPPELEWIVAQSMYTRTVIAAQLFASFMFSDQTAAAIAIAQAKPTLHIISRRWSQKAAPFIGRLLPATKQIMFGGNMMFWEYPDAFNTALEQFIRENVPRLEIAG
jgi:non-heme chloroperoxidase